MAAFYYIYLEICLSPKLTWDLINIAKWNQLIKGKGKKVVTSYLLGFTTDPKQVAEFSHWLYIWNHLDVTQDMLM